MDKTGLQEQQCLLSSNSNLPIVSYVSNKPPIAVPSSTESNINKRSLLPSSSKPLPPKCPRFLHSGSALPGINVLVPPTHLAPPAEGSNISRDPQLQTIRPTLPKQGKPAPRGHPLPPRKPTRPRIESPSSTILPPPHRRLSPPMKQTTPRNSPQLPPRAPPFVPTVASNSPASNDSENGDARHSPAIVSLENRYRIQLKIKIFYIKCVFLGLVHSVNLQDPHLEHYQS